MFDRTLDAIGALLLCLLLATAARSQIDLSIDWTLGAHSQSIRGVSLSPSGNRVATGSADGSVKRWSLLTGELVDTIGVHAAPVTDVAWSPAGTAIAAADAGGSIHIRDLGGAPEQVVSPGDASIHAIAYAPDAQKLYAAGDSGRVFVISQGIVIGEIDTSSAAIRALAVSPDGTLLAGGGDDAVLHVWRTSDLGLEHAITGHALPITGLSFSPDGEFVASCDATHVRVSRAATGFPVKNYDLTADNVSAVSFNANTELMIATRTGLLLRRDLVTNQDVVVVDTGSAAGSLESSADGSSVVLGHSFGRLALRRTSDGAVLLQLVESAGPVRALAMTADGSKVCASVGGALVDVRNTSDGTPVSNNLQYGTPNGADLTDLTVQQVCFTSTAAAYVGTCTDGMLRFWRTSNGNLLSSMDSGHGMGLCVDLTADDTLVFVGSTDGSIASFFTNGNTLDLTIPAHSDWTTTLDVSPDQQLVASGSRDERVKVWSATSGASVFDLGAHTDGVECVRFSPDGSLLASGGHDGIVRIWSPASGALLQSIATGTSKIPAVAFSPSSDVVAVSADGDLRFFDAGSGIELTGSVPEGLLVSHIEWNADTVVLGRADGTLVTTTITP